MPDRARTAPTPGGEWAPIAVGAVVVGAGVVVWGGARLAALLSGGHVRGGLGEWLRAAGRLLSDPGEPTAAWGDAASGLPGPVLYWSCTTVVAVIAAGAVTAGVWVWRRWMSASRSRFGVPAEARAARARDVAPLAVSDSVPPTGRFLLGRLAPKGPLLATEDRERHPARSRRALKGQGDRGSIALIGPTRSGKSVLIAGGLIGWDGAAVVVTVKGDLHRATAAARARRGEIAVFDPSGVTGLPTARWTPLRDVTTTSGALRAGRALAQAIPRHGVSGGDFWASHGETLTGAYMALAGLSRLLPNEDGTTREPLTMGRLASWAFLHVGITDPTVNELVRLGVDRRQPLEVQLLARDALTKLMAFHDEDPRIRASIYATARLCFEAWTEPAVAHSASLDPRATYDTDVLGDDTPRHLDLEWLMSGPPGRANTLYLTAPTTEFARLAPVLGGLLGDLREQIHAADIAGRSLSKPLVIVIDEAGQLELQWLPEEVSTIAGLGGLLVTAWQSRAQINHCYGTLADAVLGGHRSKVIFNGSDDLTTLDYASRVAGTEHVAQRGWSAEAGGGRRTVSEHLQREDLLPAHVIRQMRRQEAVLLHGTLPPIHLRTVAWWTDKHLAALVPRGLDGTPLPPPDIGTCPMVPGRSTGVTLPVDATVIDESLHRLPQPRRLGGPEPSPARPRPPKPKGDSHPQLDLTTTTPDQGSGDELVRNRVAGRCERCGTWIKVGTGTVAARGQREIVLCEPACTLDASTGAPHA